MSGSFRSKLSRDSPAYVVAGQLTTSALALVTAPLIARAIGPDGRGVTAGVISAAYIVPILVGLGVPSEVRRLAAQDDASEALRSARRLAMLAVPVSVLLSVALVASVFSGLTPPEKLAAGIAIGVAPIGVLWMCDLGVLVAQQRYRAVFSLQISTPMVLLVGVLSMTAAGHATPEGVILVSSAGTLVTAICGQVLSRVHWRGEAAGWHTLLKRGATFYGANLAEAASNRLSQVVTLPLYGSFDAGLLSVAMTVSGLNLVIGQALGAGYFRPIAREGPEGSRFTRASVSEASSLALLASAGLALCAPLLVPFVFGEGFAAAVPVVFICLAGSLPMVVGFVSSSALVAKGLGLGATASQVLGLSAQLVLLLTLVRFGAVGAAIAVTTGYAIQALIALCWLRARPSWVVPRPRSFVTGVRSLVRTPGSGKNTPTNNGSTGQADAHE